MRPEMIADESPKPYYLDSRALRAAFKPYDRKRVRRDLHDARIVSLELSAQVRRLEAERRGRVEAQILALRG